MNDDFLDEGSLERKLSAIYFADAVGYSRLTGEDEDGTYRRMVEYLDLITHAVGEHHGKIIHYAGDAVLADFATVTAAMKCAVFVRDELRNRNQALAESQQIWFRTGVNLGEVVFDQERIFGDGVNIAARLESLADPGGICISESARSAIGNKLPLRYEFMGDQAVKNIARPVRAYRVLASEAPDSVRLACPYPGMVPFSAVDNTHFHGRENEIARMAMLLRKQRFLMIIGPSGSGKSSLVHAGLLPALQESRYFGKEYWHFRSMRPGPNPTDVFRQTIEAHDASDLSEQALGNLLGKYPGAQKLLLVIDQFEEVFTQADREEQARFIAQLLAFRKLANAVLLLTFRADFYSSLMNSYLWPLDVSERIEVAPLRGDALRQAIEKPATALGVKIEANLVSQLLSDAADEPGALPLLQETMSLLWDEMDQRSLSLANYKNLKENASLPSSGDTTGLAVAIAMKADRTLQELSLSQRGIARRIFLRLIQFGEGRADTRRQQPLSALQSVHDRPGELEYTLEHLTENRLLTRSGGESHQPSLVDISHESLISSWTRLREWADERREAEQIRRRLESKAAEWVRLGQASGGLLSKVELPEAEHWLASRDAEDLGFQASLPALVNASQLELERIQEERDSIRQQELHQAEVLALEQERRITQQVAATRRLRKALAGLAALVVLAVGAGGFAWSQMQLADARRGEAQRAEQTARQLALSEAAARETAEARRIEAEDARFASIAQLLAIQVPEQQAASFDERALLMANQAFEFGRAANTQIKARLDSVLRNAASEPYFAQILRQTLTSALAISPDGNYLASIHAAPEEVVLWNMNQPDKAPTVLQGFPGKPGLFPNALTFTRDGTGLVAGSPDGTLLHWQLDQPNFPMTEWPSHEGGVWSLTNSPNQRWLALGSKENDSFMVWDMRQERAQPRLIEEPQETRGIGPALEVLGGVSVAFSPNSNTLATGSLNGTIRFWNPDNLEQPIASIDAHSGAILSLAFSSQGDRLISAGQDAAILVWNLQRPNEAPQVVDANFKAHSLTVLANDSAVVAAGDGIKLWPLDDKSRTASNLSAPSLAYQVALSPDGKMLGTAGGNGAGGLRLLNLEESGRPTELKGHEKLVLSLEFSPNGDLLASGGNPADKTIRLWNWDALNKAPRVLANQKGATNSLQFESNKNQLLTTSWNTGLVQLWDLDSPNPIPSNLRMPGLHRPWTARFSPDGERIVVTGHKGIFSWDRNALDVEAGVYLPAPSHMFGIAYSEDGAYLAASGFGPVIYVKDLTNPATPVVELVGHSPAGSRTLAFSPDGSQLASGGQDGTVRLWNPASPSEPSKILGRHDDAVTRVHFSPDGKQLASASVDQNIRLWDLENQAALPIVLSGFEGQIYGLDYHPAGKHIAAAGHVDESGTGIKIWDLTRPTNALPADQLAAIACTKVRRNLTIDEWNKFIGAEIPYRRTCANLPVHPSLIANAEKLAKSGNQDGALALLQRAVELDGTLHLDPIAQVKEWTDAISTK